MTATLHRTARNRTKTPREGANAARNYTFYMFYTDKSNGQGKGGNTTHPLTPKPRFVPRFCPTVP